MCLQPVWGRLGCAGASSDDFTLTPFSDLIASLLARYTLFGAPSEKLLGSAALSQQTDRPLPILRSNWVSFLLTIAFLWALRTVFFRWTHHVACGSYKSAPIPQVLLRYQHLLCSWKVDKTPADLNDVSAQLYRLTAALRVWCKHAVFQGPQHTNETWPGIHGRYLFWFLWCGMEIYQWHDLRSLSLPAGKQSADERCVRLVVFLVDL